MKFFIMYPPGGCLCYHALRGYYILGKLFALILTQTNILNIPVLYCKLRNLETLSPPNQTTLPLNMT